MCVLRSSAAFALFALSLRTSLLGRRCGLVPDGAGQGKQAKLSPQERCTQRLIDGWLAGMTKAGAGTSERGLCLVSCVYVAKKERELIKLEGIVFDPRRWCFVLWGISTEKDTPFALLCHE